MLASLGASQTEAGSLEATDSEDRELPQHICFVCGESKTKDGKALLKCGNCGFARYCSKECQKKAWKKHKTFCNFTKQGNELKEKDKEVSVTYIFWTIMLPFQKTESSLSFRSVTITPRLRLSTVFTH